MFCEEVEGVVVYKKHVYLMFEHLISGRADCCVVKK